MNTRYVMISSALFLGILGIALTFLSEELFQLTSMEPHPFAILAMQVMGALYVGFAIMNWMARGNLIGGIYSKPVALGNFAHFMIAGLALAKEAFTQLVEPITIILAGIYLLYTILFGWVLFGDPLRSKN